MQITICKLIFVFEIIEVVNFLILDIKCVNHVINYDMPQEIEEYVQRIGRTGRLGNQGKSTSFIDADRDYHLVEPIIKILSRVFFLYILFSLYFINF